MYDLLIKIDWIIMGFLLYSDFFLGSVIFFLKNIRIFLLYKRD